VPPKDKDTIQEVINNDFKINKKLWMCFWFVYDYLKIKNEEDIMIFYYDNEPRKLYPFDNEQIQESRKKMEKRFGF